MAPKLTQLRASDDPKLRLDILLLHCGEAVARWAERKAWIKLGMPLNLWDGPDGVRAVLESKIQELEIDQPISPLMLARRVGWVRKQPQIRKAG